jgi:hypothetical protein
MKTNSTPCLSNIEILESRIAPATLTVMNLNDAGPGSLRAAIITANATTGDRIVFAPAAHGVLTLLTGQFDITSSMTIVGPGPTRLIINGNAIDRVFDIDNTSTTNDSPVSISGLSIVNGDTPGLGGAIFSKESLTLRDVVITGNTSTGDGGAIYVHPVSADAKVIISNSTITGNNSSGGWGGGIFEYGAKSLALASTVVSGNTAGTTLSYGGGGLYAEINNTSTSLSISGCKFTGNSAGYAGGLVLGDANTAPTSKITITGTLISGNAAQDGDGGGLDLGDSAAGGGHVSITGSTIQNNTAGSGGGIVSSDFNSLAIGGSVIEGNQAASFALHAGGGGAWLGGVSPVTITGTKVLDNGTQGAGGGIFANAGVSLKLVSSVVSGNSSRSDGGGVSASGAGGVVTITGSQFSNNSAGGGGGGLFLAELNSVTISGSRLTGNTSGTAGGGLFLGNVTAFSVRGVTASGNSAGTDGGGISVEEGAGSILGTSIFGNTARHGGGVFISASILTLQEALVTGNVAAAAPNIAGSYTPFP